MSEFEKSIDNNLLDEMQMKKLKDEISKCLKNYEKTIKYMVQDAPIQILGLPRNLQKKLIKNNCLRIYDFIELDFGKIEWLDDVDIRDLTARLNEFLSML